VLGAFVVLDGPKKSRFLWRVVPAGEIWRCAAHRGVPGAALAVPLKDDATAGTLARAAMSNRLASTRTGPVHSRPRL